MPENVRPPTPTERLEAILARSEVPTSATTQIALLHDPRTLLAAAVACYQDAIVVAAEKHAGTELVAQLDDAAEAILPGLAEADAWPVARSHLLVIDAENVDPFSALRYVVNVDSLADARDPAAVIDHRLDIVSLQASRQDGPLPWLPPVPKKITEPDWRDYLDARRELVARLAEQVRQMAETPETVPGWAKALVQPPEPEVVAQIELWRAAHSITDADLTPTGPMQHHLIEARAQHRLDGLIAGESEPAVEWLGRIHDAVPATIEDPATIRLARECADIDPSGNWLPLHVKQEARTPLPDDHKADALRYRLEPWLNQVWETWPRTEAYHDPRRHQPPSLSPHHRPDHGISI